MDHVFEVYFSQKRPALGGEISIAEHLQLRLARRTGRSGRNLCKSALGMRTMLTGRIPAIEMSGKILLSLAQAKNAASISCPTTDDGVVSLKEKNCRA